MVPGAASKKRGPPESPLHESCPDRPPKQTWKIVTPNYHNLYLLRYFGLPVLISVTRNISLFQIHLFVNQRFSFVHSFAGGEINERQRDLLQHLGISAPLRMPPADHYSVSTRKEGADV